MNRADKILIQTTIPAREDDWSVARFTRLAALLSEQRDDLGASLYEVTARDRTEPGTPDPVLCEIDESDFDQLWLIAADTGDGLTKDDCAAIGRFRRSGRGLFVTRDHMDLGSSLCTLGGIGNAHYFHSRHPDPETVRNQPDDNCTTSISWPNYHSGANGDFQEIIVMGPAHPVLASLGSPTGSIRFLPSHPHEGGIGVPEGKDARVIMKGRSMTTGRDFNIAIAFEPGRDGGPAIAQSTFHHFADYNWDPDSGCPSFVTEEPSNGLKRFPDALADTHQYVLNIAAWLASNGSPALRANRLVTELSAR
jgi:hypothetical protein